MKFKNDSNSEDFFSVITNFWDLFFVSTNIPVSLSKIWYAYAYNIKIAKNTLHIGISVSAYNLGFYV